MFCVSRLLQSTFKKCLWQKKQKTNKQTKNQQKLHMSVERAVSQHGMGGCSEREH